MLDKVSMINALPLRYLPQIRTAPGVADVTHANWFGGIYQDPRNDFAKLAVEAESWLRVHPEFLVPDDQKRTWLADRTGALVGADTARRFGWNIGDRVPVQGTIYRRPDGRPWELTIDAIYHAQEGTADRTQLFFHQAYLNETLARARTRRSHLLRHQGGRPRGGTGGRPARRLFALVAQTRTSTEKAFV